MSDAPHTERRTPDMDNTEASADTSESAGLVGVSYYGRDWVLTVVWHTSPEVSDDTLIAAAAAWFAEKYGFNPADHALRADVRPVPPTTQN